MRAIVTAGPTYEPLDSVRRLTNFSTGSLGTELALHLQASGFEVHLLLGEHATFPAPTVAGLRVERFGSTTDLLARITLAAAQGADLCCHAAAVSDFQFGNIFTRNELGQLMPVTGGKIPTQKGQLLAELLPTPKILARLRELFPSTFIVGWKYEVDGSPQTALELGAKQLRENQTNACVVNGPAYGPGFAWVQPRQKIIPIPDRPHLYAQIEQAARSLKQDRPASSAD